MGAQRGWQRALSPEQRVELRLQRLSPGPFFGRRACPAAVAAGAGTAAAAAAAATTPPRRGGRNGDATAGDTASIVAALLET
jgi:hypothetical protein